MHTHMLTEVLTDYLTGSHAFSLTHTHLLSLSLALSLSLSLSLSHVHTHTTRTGSMQVEGAAPGAQVARAGLVHDRVCDLELRPLRWCANAFLR